MPSAVAAARRTVTVLFCDLAGSTELGERLDPESLRGLLARWYDAMRTAVESHGGQVEKFIGDAVMAVFGVPHIHEDDALRAVRAAVEMRNALARLNTALLAEGRPGLRIRIGINTGEVVTGDGTTTLVTGDAVNTAKRLEEAASSDEILIGATTRRLVENAAELEPAGPVTAKGKRDPVEAWRVLETIDGAQPFARRLDAPLVGRGSELAFLRDELDAATRERACRLVTVFGVAGIGKSRLAAELLGEIADHAAVLSARCLPYGDGISFLPLTELVRSAGGDEAIIRAVEAEPDGDLIVERVCGTVDPGSAPASSEETFWAIRRLLETLARDRPVVVCLEDVHWAEPTFLDLLEYVAGWSRDSPILLLCIARPDLLDERPRWGGSALRLEPLTESESGALLDELATEWPLSPEARAEIAAAAEGNPLYVEQMVAMFADAEHPTFAIPPTIQALLGARLDRLDRLERSVLERAAVAGKEFWRGAVSALSPEDERPAVGATLLSLVRKELVRPERSAAVGDDGFRFRHALIRDAAYAEIPKSTRADLHERFAQWLADAAAEDELVGYHLEQASRYRADLGDPDPATADRAADLLATAGGRAYARDDMSAARNLIARALALGDLGDRRAELLRQLAGAHWGTSDIAGAMDVIDQAIDCAQRTGNQRQEWYARLERAARGRLLRTGDDDLVEVATEAVRVFESLGDDTGLARAWRRLALVSMTNWRYAEGAERAQRALEHARRSDDRADDVAIADIFCTALLNGPEPAQRATDRCRELLSSLPPSPVVTATVNSTLSALAAMQGSVDEARALAAAAAATYDSLGLRLMRAGLAELIATNELLAGDTVAAERELRLALELHADGAPPLAGLLATQLVDIVLRQGRVYEAEQLLEYARGTVEDGDVDGYVAIRLAEARVAAVHGRRDDAVQFVDEAIEAMADTDALGLRADTLALRAAAAGDKPVEALALYELKGNIAAAARLVTPRPPR
jgi:class 3 adenylate cyclase/tetratricopeptide (TPR) repeat protein